MREIHLRNFYMLAGFEFRSITPVPQVEEETIIDA